ncbi:hypothetical protein HHK36_024263 [Tetracentron sinense]|uniref:Complex 1 LYR protein domain-containing protein n=1 Tax=Tetracentron sinense TaxID=13715 RepID=A0A834YIP3_TETSI|nr:hypothetical protein HHK36_024263 [Tetracentron sinense]
MASALSEPSRAAILSLFRSLLRTARQFSDYNIREYSKRRTIDGFRQNRELSDLSLVSSAFSDGKSQLEVARRQVWYHMALLDVNHFQVVEFRA